MTGIQPSASTDFEHINLADGEVTPEDREPIPTSTSIDQQPAQEGGKMASGQEATGAAGSKSSGRQGTSEPPTSEPGTAPAAQGHSGAEDPLKEIEEAAAKVAEQARHAAHAASHKFREGALEARESLKGLAANFSSWWSTLEPGNQFALPGVSTQSKHQDYAAIQESLGLDSGEAVLESFKCHLLQTYSPVNNPFTPDRKIPFPGQLHITSRRVCFVVEQGGGGGEAVDPLKLDIKGIKGVKKEKGGAGLPDCLVLSLSDDGSRTLVFSGFHLKELEIDSALALLEHLMSE